MANEPELIRQEMQQTRSGLALHRLQEPTARAPYLPSVPAPVRRTEENWTAGRGTVAARPAETTAVPAAESWGSTLLNNFEPEVQKLKGLAIGAVFNVLK